MSAPAALTVRSLDFAYEDQQVLFGVDLEVAEGDAVALLGTNGAGKTTLLRAVAGLEHPRAGEVRFFGEDVTGRPAEQKARRGLVLIPGGRGTFASLTVAENLRCASYLLRRERATERRVLDEVFELFPVLRERAGQSAGTLSGGEQQMLALARALLTRPRLLMIDELSLGLAPLVVEQLVRTLALLRERGITLLLVEQSVNLSLSIASNAYFLERGRIRFHGAAADLAGRTDLLRSVFLGGPPQRD